jgi:hypothetical protein
MSGEWRFTRPAMRAALEVFDRIPAEIADRMSFSVCQTGHVSFQPGNDRPASERVDHVRRIAAVIGVEPVWKAMTTTPGTWSLHAGHAVSEEIGLAVFTHVSADELTDLAADLVPDLLEVAG